MHQDILELSRWTQTQGFALKLPSERLNFLMVLAFLNEHQLDGVFEESELVEAFWASEQAFGHPIDPHPAKANLAINNLVQQRLLLRFAGSWVENGAVYRLSPLGMAIADHYLHDKRFSHLSLALQLQQVALGMQQAVEAAEKGGDPPHWKAQVFGPLRYCVAELFDRIDQNQRAFDVQQEATKQRISELIHQQWGAALQQCQELLEETSDVLQEFKGGLEAVGYNLQAALLKLHMRVCGVEELRYLSELIQDLQRKLDRILGWSERMIELWARYDRHVHKFLRTVLAIHQAHRYPALLRESISTFTEQPWQLCVVEAPKLKEYDPLHRPATPTLATGAYEALRTALAPSPAQLHAREAMEAWYRDWLQQHPKQARSARGPLQAYLDQGPAQEAATRARRFLPILLSSGDAQAAHAGHSADWEALAPHPLELHAYPLDQADDA